MHKFNPVEYMRETWGDRLHTKNRPKQCKSDHKYCHLPYEWGTEGVHSNAVGCVEGEAPIKLPENAEDGNAISYDLMTE
jgi:hypothetical protein